MRDSWIWSVSLGRWWNVQVRLHLFFVLFAVFTLYLSSIQLSGQPTWLGVGCVVTLLTSVLLHEIGHVVVARRLGGLGDEIVIGPLGGLNPVRVPYEPLSELVALMAGPLVNAGLCLLAGITLTFFPDVELVGLLNPLSPVRIASGTAVEISLKLFFWINWLLILFNMIPAYPFDGGRALRAGLMFLWPELDPRQSLVTVARLAKVTAAMLLVAAVLVAKNDAVLVPPWLALTLLAIFVFFSARREEMQFADAAGNNEHAFGYDFSRGYTSLEGSLEADDEAATTPDARASILSRWWEQRREARARRLREQEANDEQRVDEILSRLHQRGMHSLSREDRELLQRVSQRYRSRQM